LPDHDALRMAANLLADGESSRLYKELVRERGVAVEVDASVEGHHGPDELEITVKGATGASTTTLTHLVEQDLEALARTGPTSAEMEKLRRRAEAHFFLGLQSNLSRAQLFADLELLGEGATHFRDQLSRELLVSPDDIRRVVKTYLTRPRRSVVEVRPSRK
jgi:zinc protease